MLKVDFQDLENYRLSLSLNSDNMAWLFFSGICGILITRMQCIDQRNVGHLYRTFKDMLKHDRWRMFIRGVPATIISIKILQVGFELSLHFKEMRRSKLAQERIDALKKTDWAKDVSYKEFENKIYQNKTTQEKILDTLLKYSHLSWIVMA